MSKPIKQSEAGLLSSKLRDGAVKLVKGCTFPVINGKTNIR